MDPLYIFYSIFHKYNVSIDIWFVCKKYYSINLNDSTILEATKRYHNLNIFKMMYGDIRYWDVSHVTDMNSLFCNSYKFNEDISRWDTSSVTNMSNMFCYANSFNQNISSWNTSKVKNMFKMFFCAENFDQDISKWDISKVKNMSYMFNSSKIDKNKINWNLENVENKIEMFNETHGASRTGAVRTGAKSCAILVKTLN